MAHVQARMAHEVRTGFGAVATGFNTAAEAAAEQQARASAPHPPPASQAPRLRPAPRSIHPRRASCSRGWAWRTAPRWSRTWEASRTPSRRGRHAAPREYTVSVPPRLTASLPCESQTKLLQGVREGKKATERATVRAPLHTRHKPAAHASRGPRSGGGQG